MPNSRSDTLETLCRDEYDLLIIGGGITGAGSALDAAARGMRVALVEKGDFASGTSSRSTKLIHGGLRYLKQFEIGLVREVGRERAIIHRLAPHLVIPEKMLLPLIEGGTFGRWATSIGLFTYDLLAGVTGDDRYKMLNKEEALQQEPLLPADKLLGAGYYSEYRTDDARLTIEVMKTAARHGAQVINYVQAEDLLYKDGRVAGAHCRDVLTDTTYTIRAKMVVNATGPWSDELRRADGSLGDKHIFQTKGVHIVVHRHDFPVRQAIYFDVPDGRMVFAIPRLNYVYVGTTDTPYHGDLDHIPAEPQDIQYLLDAVNQMFPDILLPKEKVLATWAGVRPLIYEAGKSASEISRKDEIFESESGLLTIAGGKLTGYRAMAEKIIDRVAKRLRRHFNLHFGDCRTKEIPLTPRPFRSVGDVQAFQARITGFLQDQKHVSQPELVAAYLVQNYGRQTEDILQKWATRDGKDLETAEHDFCAENEWVIRREDFDRRTGRALFPPPG